LSASSANVIRETTTTTITTTTTTTDDDDTDDDINDAQSDERERETEREIVFHTNTSRQHDKIRRLSPLTKVECKIVPRERISSGISRRIYSSL